MIDSLLNMLSLNKGNTKYIDFARGSNELDTSLKKAWKKRKLKKWQ